MALTVKPVAGRSELRRFIELPYRLHRDDPAFVPQLLISEWEKFTPAKNPFFEHARMELFLAERDGRTVGRIAAIDDDNHNATHGDNIMFFGFFEAEDGAAAAALWQAVEDHARQLGRSAVRGPANPSMNDGSGFQLNAFDEPPFLMMPQNPPSYPHWAEEAGYAKVMDLLAWRFDVSQGPTPKLQRLAERVRNRYRPVVRQVDVKNLDRDAAILGRLYNEAWEKNWGFVKYTEKEFAHLVSELRLIIDPALALFVEVDGQVAGTAIALPDVNQLFQRMNGRLLPTGIFTLLRRRSIITRTRLPIMGIMPEFRNRGLELVLINDVAMNAMKRGYTDGECSWVLETNTATNRAIEAAGGTAYKTYRLYQKDL